MESFKSSGPEGESRNVSQHNSTTASTASTATSISSGRSNGENYIFPSSSFPGMTYKHRMNSFLDNQWPLMNSSCSPHKLAMAGLMYYGGNEPSAKCFICQSILKGLKENSDPWELHAKKNDTCPFIKLGQRQDPREYTIYEMIAMFKDKHVQTFANGYKSAQLELYNAVLQEAETEVEMEVPEQ